MTSEDIKDIPDISKESNIHNLVNMLQRRISDCKFGVTPKKDFDFLAKFIRSRKYDTEAAAVAYQKYYDHISRNLRRIEGIKPSHYVAAYESRTLVVLKNKFNGTKILLITVANWDTSVVSIRDLQDCGLLLCEEALKDPDVQPYGSIVIFDLAGLGFCHMKQLTLPEIKYFITMGLEGVPARVAGIHLVNAPMVYWAIHKVIMKVLPEKIRNRLHLHNNLKDLHSMIDKDCLPESLGGKLDIEEAMDNELLIRLFKNDNKYEDYWSGTELKPRRLLRKRSSMMMVN